MRTSWQHLSTSLDPTDAVSASPDCGEKEKTNKFIRRTYSMELDGLHEREPGNRKILVRRALQRPRRRGGGSLQATEHPHPTHQPRQRTATFPADSAQDADSTSC